MLLLTGHRCPWELVSCASLVFVFGALLVLALSANFLLSD